MRRFVFLLFTIVFCFLSFQVFTNAGGPVTGVAGDPPFEETCAAAGCHTGSALNSGGATVSITCADSLGNTVTSYVPNRKYTITLSISEGTKTRYGFEAIVLKGTGNLANAIGTLSLSEPTKTQLFGGSLLYVMHKTAGIDFTGNTGSWSFNWKAPAANNGTATIYAAFNASNKNTTSSGDKIYTKTLQLTGTGTFVGLNPSLALMTKGVFPNPATSHLVLETSEEDVIQIYDLNGALVKEFPGSKGTAIYTIEELVSGIYIARIKTLEATTSYKFIKQ